ncbi:MAG: hypothetical protein KC476_09955 [Cyanobacteria bacterium HKST-UBA06]|nr:hypothetical protein [Cyanobacteria bacterium HKST-UBA06]
MEPLPVYVYTKPGQALVNDVQQAFGRSFAVTDDSQGVLLLAGADPNANGWDGHTYDLGPGNDFIVADLEGATYTFSPDKKQVTITSAALPKGVTFKNVEGVLAVQTNPNTFQSTVQTTVNGKTSTTRHPAFEYDLFARWPSMFAPSPDDPAHTLVEASAYQVPVGK